VAVVVGRSCRRRNANGKEETGQETHQVEEARSGQATLLRPFRDRENNGLRVEDHANPEHPERSLRAVHDAGLRASAASPSDARSSRIQRRSSLLGGDSCCRGCGDPLLYWGMSAAEAWPLIRRKFAPRPTLDEVLPALNFSTDVDLFCVFSAVPGLAGGITPSHPLHSTRDGLRPCSAGHLDPDLPITM